MNTNPNNTSEDANPTVSPLPVVGSVGGSPTMTVVVSVHAEGRFKHHGDPDGMPGIVIGGSVVVVIRHRTYLLHVVHRFRSVPAQHPSFPDRQSVPIAV